MEPILKIDGKNIILFLLPCPFCGDYCAFNLPLTGGLAHPESWHWKINCGNVDCSVYEMYCLQTIRKSQRFEPSKFLVKLLTLGEDWNRRIENHGLKLTGYSISFAPWFDEFGSSHDKQIGQFSRERVFGEGLTEKHFLKK